jgi:transcriptional regulator NrdR family protein
MSNDANVTGIACPTCGATRNTVTDSRNSSDNSYIRRRRQCQSCPTRFSTHETVVSDGTGAFLVTTTGRRIPLDLDFGLLAEKVGAEVGQDVAKALKHQIREALK